RSAPRHDPRDARARTHPRGDAQGAVVRRRLPARDLPALHAETRRASCRPLQAPGQVPGRPAGRHSTREGLKKMPTVPGAGKLDPSVLIAALASWPRLESLPLTTDLAAALAAPVADPLWLLARQWQSAELHGEDAGSPIGLQLEGETARLARFLPG